jgi:alanyl-tRNA synthetase
MTAMLDTEKLYYDKPGLFAAEATVLAVEGRSIVLDRTIFYPEGGGQACDLGTIGPAVGAAGGRADRPPALPVASVVEEGGRLLHRMQGVCAFEPGDRVSLIVDPARRVDYSQQHTAEHLIASSALRLVGARAVSVHFGADRSLVDFDLPSIAEDELAAVEEEVDRIIADDYPIRTHLCPPEDLSSFPLRRKPPEGESLVRVVEIDGIDFTPCCGLHLASTGALRLVRLFGGERYKGMTRVYFAAGARAAADYRALSRIARDASRALGSSEAGLAGAAAREAERRRGLELSLAGLERERNANEAAAAPERAEGRVALRRYSDRGADSLMETAKAYASAGMTALLASLPELTVQVLAPRPEARLGESLKGLLAASGGRGGGGRESFRAVFADSSGLESFLAAAFSELG